MELNNIPQEYQQYDNIYQTDEFTPIQNSLQSSYEKSGPQFHDTGNPLGFNEPDQRNPNQYRVIHRSGNDVSMHSGHSKVQFARNDYHSNYDDSNPVLQTKLSGFSGHANLPVGNLVKASGFGKTARRPKEAHEQNYHTQANNRSKIYHDINTSFRNGFTFLYKFAYIHFNHSFHPFFLQHNTSKVWSMYSDIHIPSIQPFFRLLIYKIKY